MYSPPMLHFRHMLEKKLFGASTETMWAPGAYTSGFWKPSWVVPWLDHGAIVSLSGLDEPFSSTAPTVITYGSLAGAKSTAPGTAPRFPAATTTVSPCIQADSAAASSGSVLYDWA